MLFFIEGWFGVPILYSVGPGHVFVFFFIDGVFLSCESSLFCIEILLEIRKGEITVGCTRHQYNSQINITHPTVSHISLPSAIYPSIHHLNHYSSFLTVLD